VALEAERITLRSQEFLLITTMWLMASRAALSKCGLVVYRLLRLFRLFGMAREANIHRIGLGESGRSASVRAVAIGAIPHGTRVLDLRTFNLLCLFLVTCDAQFTGARLRQDDFAVFRCLMADFALLFAERWMHESLHQFWPVGLVRVVTGQTIRLFERLILMRLRQIDVLYVVAIQAQRRGRFRKVILEFCTRARPGLVIGVAGVTTCVERQVTAAFLRRILSDRVAT
jgi:hypothetical protein